MASLKQASAEACDAVVTKNCTMHGRRRITTDEKLAALTLAYPSRPSTHVH